VFVIVVIFVFKFEFNFGENVERALGTAGKMMLMRWGFLLRLRLPFSGPEACLWSR
jgi:hypothetical protein